MENSRKGRIESVEGIDEFNSWCDEPIVGDETWRRKGEEKAFGGTWDLVHGRDAVCVSDYDYATQLNFGNIFHNCFHYVVPLKCRCPKSTFVMICSKCKVNFCDEECLRSQVENRGVLSPEAKEIMKMNKLQKPQAKNCHSNKRRESNNNCHFKDGGGENSEKVIGSQSACRSTLLSNSPSRTIKSSFTTGSERSAKNWTEKKGTKSPSNEITRDKVVQRERDFMRNSEGDYQNTSKSCPVGNENYTIEGRGRGKKVINQQANSLEVGKVQVLQKRLDVRSTRAIDVQFQLPVSAFSQMGCVDVQSASLLGLTAPKGARVQSQLTNTLRELDERNLQGVENVSAGDYVLAQYQDYHQMYRGKVLEVDGERLLIYFVDYGNTEVKCRNSLRHFPDELKDIQPYALPFQLSNVLPCGQHWPPEAKQFVQTHCHMKTVNCFPKYFERCESTGVHKYKGTIQIRNSDSWQDLGQILIAKGWAKIRNQREMDGWEVYGAKVFPAALAPQLTLHKKLDVTICHVNDLQDFYVTLVEERKEREGVFLQLNRLLERNSVTDVYNPTKGNICAAQVANRWERVKVWQFKPHSVVAIQIDNGQLVRDILSVDQLRELPEDLKCVPAFAYHCSLAVKAKSDNVIINLKDIGKTSLQVKCFHIEKDVHVVEVYPCKDSAGWSQSLVNIGDASACNGQSPPPPHSIEQSKLESATCLPLSPTLHSLQEKNERFRVHFKTLPMPHIVFIVPENNDYCHIADAVANQFHLLQKKPQLKGDFSVREKDVVCLQNLQKGLGVRGIVDNIDGEGKALVLLADYGTYVKLPVSQLFPPNPQIMQFAPVGYLINLAKVAQTSLRIMPTSEKRFENKLNSCLFRLNIVGDVSHDLLLPIYDADLSLAEEQESLLSQMVINLAKMQWELFHEAGYTSSTTILKRGEWPVKSLADFFNGEATMPLQKVMTRNILKVFLLDGVLHLVLLKDKSKKEFKDMMTKLRCYCNRVKTDTDLQYCQFVALRVTNQLNMVSKSFDTQWLRCIKSDSTVVCLDGLTQWATDDDQVAEVRELCPEFLELPSVSFLARAPGISLEEEMIRRICFAGNELTFSLLDVHKQPGERNLYTLQSPILTKLMATSAMNAEQMQEGCHDN